MSTYVTYDGHIMADSITDKDYNIIRYKCFECDELIAPIVAVLNAKGYRTIYSCQGHYHPDESKENKYGEDAIVEGNSTFIVPYIIFSPKVKSFPIDPPSEWEIEIVERYNHQKNLSLRSFWIEKFYKDPHTVYDGIDGMFDYVSDTIDIMRRLYSWALQLPEFKEE